MFVEETLPRFTTPEAYKLVVVAFVDVTLVNNPPTAVTVPEAKTFNQELVIEPKLNALDPFGVRLDVMVETLRLVEVTLVKEPVDGVVEPMMVPSMFPPLMVASVTYKFVVVTDVPVPFVKFKLGVVAYPVYKLVVETLPRLTTPEAYRLVDVTLVNVSFTAKIVPEE